MQTETNEKLAINRVENRLLITLPAKLDYLKCDHYQAQILTQVENSQCLGVIIDLSMNNIIDSSTMQRIIALSKMCKLLGSPCVLIGLSAALVCSLMDYNLELETLITAPTLTDALALLTPIRQYHERADDEDENEDEDEIVKQQTNDNLINEPEEFIYN